METFSALLTICAGNSSKQRLGLWFETPSRSLWRHCNEMVTGLSVVSPRRAITRAQSEWSPRGETTHSGVDVNNTHLSMINLDYNMMPTISVRINQYSLILLIKSKLKLESRAIAVGVAMSPRNFGGKYRCRPHPRWRKCTRQFFVGSRAC